MQQEEEEEEEELAILRVRIYLISNIISNRYYLYIKVSWGDFLELSGTMFTE